MTGISRCSDSLLFTILSKSKESLFAKSYNAAGIIGPLRSDVAHWWEGHGVVTVVGRVGSVLIHECVW